MSMTRFAVGFGAPSLPLLTWASETRGDARRSIPKTKELRFMGRRGMENTPIGGKSGDGRARRLKLILGNLPHPE